MFILFVTVSKFEQLWPHFTKLLYVSLQNMTLKVCMQCFWKKLWKWPIFVNSNTDIYFVSKYKCKNNVMSIVKNVYFVCYHFQIWTIVTTFYKTIVCEPSKYDLKSLHAMFLKKIVKVAHIWK